MQVDALVEMPCTQNLLHASIVKSADRCDNVSDVTVGYGSETNGSKRRLDVAVHQGGHVNSDQLRYFTALYRYGNAQEAAKHVFLSRQGLVKSLNSLEHELGVELFDDKTAPSCKPSRYGEAFYEFVEKSYDAKHSLLKEFDAIRALEEGTVRCAASIGVMGLFGIEIIKKFETVNPGVSVDCSEAPDIACDNLLESGSCSLAFTVAPFDPRFETRLLYSTKRCVWVSPKDPLSRRDSISIADLQDYEIGVVGKLFKNYESLLGACQEEGVQPESIDTFSEMTQLYQYASRPGRVSFTSPHVSSMFSSLYGGSDAPVVSIPFETLPWQIGISWNKGHHLGDIEEKFVKHCEAYAHGLLKKN